MTISTRHLVLFVAALVLANAISVFAIAAIFRAVPGLRDHHPGF